MLKIAYLIVLITGCVLGAGFVSGSELWLFFGQYGIYSIAFAMLFIIIFCLGLYKAMMLKQKYLLNSLFELNKLLLPRSYNVVDFVIKTCYLLFASAMLAGIQVIAGDIFVIAALVLSFFIVVFNKKTLMQLNLVLVPIVIVFILCLSFYNIDTVSFEFLVVNNCNIFSGVVGGIFYASVNLLLGFGALFRSYSKLTKKSIILITCICGLILLVLCVLVLALISPNQYNTLELPLARVALESGAFLSICGELIIIASIVTTFIACVFGVHSEQDSKLKFFTILCLIFCLSCMGFSSILIVGYYAVGFFAFLYYLALINKN